MFNLNNIKNLELFVVENKMLFNVYNNYVLFLGWNK